MAELRNFGVGTGATPNGITGRKLTFSNTEKIYAEQVWDDVEPNDLFTIEWYKEVPGQVKGKLIVRHNWTNSAGYSSIYHQSWIKGYGAGDYHVSFLRNGTLEKGIAFKVRAEAPPTPPKPPKPKPRIISGIVTTKLLKTPIALAKVTFGNKSDTTSADGKYSISNPAEMSGLITCSAPGFKTIKRTITAPVEGTLTENFELVSSAPPTPPKKTWWKKLLELITDVNLAPFLVSDALFQKGYKLLTGKEMTDAEFEKHKLELSNQILPINTLLKLFTGKNLKGEPEEFGTAGDWFDLILTVPLFLIPGNVDDVAAKAAEKALTSKEAEKIVAELGKKKIAAKLIKIVKAKPSTSAKLLSKFPAEVRDAVIKGLGKTAYGREVIYTLSKSGYFKYTAPIWKKAASVLFKAGTIGMTATLPIFAVTEIPNLFNMMQFARKQRLEAEGKWPSDIAYKLNNYEDTLKSYARSIDDAIKSEDMEKAKDLMEKLKKAFEDYKAYREEKKADMLPEDYDTSSLAVDFYIKFIEDREKKIKVPVVKKGILSVTSNIENSDVYVNGSKVGQTPYKKELEAKTYHVLVTKFKYTSDEKDVEVLPEKTVGFPASIELITPPAPKKSTLDISVEPNDAVLEVAGHPEITKMGSYELDPGSYTIKASKEGFYDKSVTAIAKEDKITEVSIVLTKKTPAPPAPPTPPTPPVPPVPKKATITITSEPTNAQVYIDGEYTWATTPYTVLLAPGEHIFRVQMKGYYPIEITGVVEEGEVSELPFTLEAIPAPEIPPEPYIPQQPYIPTYHPATPYVPSIVYTPPEEIPPYNYSNLSPELMTIPPAEPVSPPAEEELIINVETTDINPWNGRIYSIAVLELSKPDAETKVLSGDNEEELINLFLDWFDAGNYKTLVGYNTAFDYRYIFTKMMLYRRPSKSFKDIELKDVMQIMKQVKEKFVFNMNKPGKLDDWGKMLLGKGKYGTQELMLRKYIQGDFDYVRAFQERQIELTKGLYDLARFVSSEASILSPASTPEESLSPVLTPSTETIEEKKTKVCPVCKAYNYPSAKVCEICGASI